MTLIVEDGSIVPGANTFAGVQEAATFHAERGGLIPVSEVASDEVTFAAGGVMSAPAGAFALVTAQSIIEVRGAANAGNNGFAHVRTVTDTTITATWLATVAEDPGADVRITVFEQSGWWHAAPARLEASLINAATFMSTRYAWAGSPVTVDQPLPWPRRGVPASTPAASIDSGWMSMLGLDGLGSGPEVPSNTVPVGVVRCQLWLSLADIEAPLLASVDPQEFLVAKTVGASGISKTFGGRVRLRRHPHADAEVARYLDAQAVAGPFRAIDRV